MRGKPKGTLVIVGGHEDKAQNSDRTILTRVARKARGEKGRLLIITVASEQPEAMGEAYLAAFRDLGVRHVDVLDLRTRDDGYDEAVVRKVEQADVVFFTGGDQLRITSQVGDTPAFQCLQEVYHAGATIAGTSAGAAAMPQTMLIAGPGDESYEISSLGMAPGLGLIDGVVIDSHFAQRGRMGRLLGAVTQNPRNVGLGIDEDTAVVVEPGNSMCVIGSGAVYVVDGTGITYSSLSEEKPEGVMSIHDVRLHVLASGDRFDLSRKRPVDDGAAEAEAS